MPWLRHPIRCCGTLTKIVETTCGRKAVCDLSLAHEPCSAVIAVVALSGGEPAIETMQELSQPRRVLQVPPHELATALASCLRSCHVT